MKVIIIGGGKVGAYIAKLLLENNCEVKLIESREQVINRLKGEIPEEILVHGSGTDPSILEACGIKEADVVTAVTGSDEANLVASTIAKFEFGIHRVIARVVNPQNAWLFNRGMGVDVALNQADLMAHLVVEEMDVKNMLTLMKLNRGDYSIVQVKVDSESEAVNKALRDLTMPEKSLLISISRGKEVIIPHGDTVFKNGDIVLAFADKEAQVTINKIFGSI